MHAQGYAYDSSRYEATMSKETPKVAREVSERIPQTVMADSLSEGALKAIVNGVVTKLQTTCDDTSAGPSRKAPEGATGGTLKDRE